MDERRLRLRVRRDSLILVYGRDQEIADFVCRHAPHAEHGFSKFATIGVEHNGELIAGVVFTDYHGHAISVSMASTSPLWASRRTLAGIFAYPFVQLNCDRLTACTGRSMVSVREFLERLGFVEEGLLRRGFADDDCVIYGMLREECRWIRTNHERQPLSAAAA